jgi:hypothetical protein
MKIKMFVLMMSSILFVQCDKNDDEMVVSGNFMVSIENVMEESSFFASGVFNTPEGASEPGGAGPGHTYVFTFNAGKGSRLSFATMFVGSNDLFFGPDENGLELYDGDNPVSGDLTAQVYLWDAGTEVNEAPGAGPNQPGSQSGPNTGMDEMGTVKEISQVSDGFTYPAVDQTIKVSISNDGGSMFTLRIDNLAGSTTPVAPGVWVVHSDAGVLFTPGMTAPGMGLEALAEDGNPGGLGDHLSDNSGLVSPLAPGAWAVHSMGSMVLFSDNMSDYGEGLEGLAEDGDPTSLLASLGSKSEVTASGVFNTPAGSSGPGPLFPGSKYEFTFTAQEDQWLSFATMFVQSNDLFYSIGGESGIALWNNGIPLSGDVTSGLMLWDAGTEVNEYPGAGLHQPPRINGGSTENGVVKMVDDGFIYPAVNEVIKVSITPMQ